MKVPFARFLQLARRIFWRIGDKIRRNQYWQKPMAPHVVPSALPLRIVFLVCESGKWTQQRVFDRLAATPGLDVSFALTPSDLAIRLDAENRARHHARQRSAFAELGRISYDLLGPNDQLSELYTVEAELIILQQPWGMQDAPRLLARRAACAHISYELGVVDDPVQQFALPDFHPWLWRMFVPSQMHAEMIRRTPGAIDSNRVIVTGSPRLDAWREMLQARTSQALPCRPTTIVWAPHHSLESNSLRLGTFDWSAAVMLDLVRSQPDMSFVLRPHPNLWHVLNKRKPGSSSAFLSAWQMLPNTAMSEDGDPLPVLLDADALITDSASFLAEFMLSGRPIFRLSRTDSTPMSQFGKGLLPGLYDCPNSEALLSLFSNVLITGKDPLRNVRVALSNELYPDVTMNSATRIRDEILKVRRR